MPSFLAIPTFPPTLPVLFLTPSRSIPASSSAESKSYSFDPSSGFSGQLYRRASAFLLALSTPVGAIKKSVHALWQPLRDGMKNFRAALIQRSASINHSIGLFKPCFHGTASSQMIISGPTANTAPQAQSFLSAEDEILLEHARQAKALQTQARAHRYLSNDSPSQASTSPSRNDASVKNTDVIYQRIAKSLDAVRAGLQENSFDASFHEKLPLALNELVQLAENHQTLTHFEGLPLLENDAPAHSWELRSLMLRSNRETIKQLIQSLNLETELEAEHDFLSTELSNLADVVLKLKPLDSVSDFFSSDYHLAELINSLKEKLSYLPLSNRTARLKLDVEEQKAGLVKLNGSYLKSRDNSDNKLKAQQQKAYDSQFCTQANRQLEIYATTLVEGANLIAQGLNKKYFPAQSFHELERQLFATTRQAINLCIKHKDYVLLTRLTSSLLNAHEQGRPVFSLIESTCTQQLLKKVQDFLSAAILKMCQCAAIEYQPRWERCKSDLQTSGAKYASNAALLEVGKKEYAEIEKSRDELIQLLLEHNPKTVQTTIKNKAIAHTQPNADPNDSQAGAVKTASSASALSHQQAPLNINAIAPLCRVLSALDNTLKRLQALCEITETLKSNLRKSRLEKSEKNILPKKCQTWMLNPSEQRSNGQRVFI